MDNILDTITDQRAVEILTTVAKGRGLLKDAAGIELREAQAALAAAFGQPEPGDIPTEGELARQCLRLLSQDPDTADAIATMAAQPDQGPQRFMLKQVGAITLALAVLTTSMHFEVKDDAGKTVLVVDKKDLSDEVLKKVVDLFLRFIPGK